MKKTGCEVIFHAARALWLTFAMACLPALANDAALAGEPARPYAVIDWPSPLNPGFAPLGDGLYLLATASGMQIWDARKNLFQASLQWPKEREISGLWSALDGGRVLAGKDRITTFDSLVWWSRTEKTFSEPLALPAFTRVEALIPVGEHRVLACVRVGDGLSKKYVDRNTLPTRAVVLEQVNNTLRLSANITPALRAALLDAGVRGEVEGSGRLNDAPTQNVFPLIFNTANCKWEMRNAPDELKNAQHLKIKHHRLPNGAILVAHADWFDTQRKTGANLIAPYLWNAEFGRWDLTVSTAQSGGSVRTFDNFDVDDPVVTTTAVGAEFIEFLDTKTLRWTRSAQRLPSGTYAPKPAPFDNDKVLVFLREGGQVLLMEPMKAATPGEFSYAHSYLGEVPLSHASVLLLGGGSQWHPTNRPELLRASRQPEVKAIAPLPSPWNNLQGVELRDKTVLAFGGLPPGCELDVTRKECQKLEAPPVYRYFPQADRWETVPDLLVRSNGESYEYANHIDHRWPRGSAMVRGNGDFVFLDGPTAEQVRAQELTPLTSQAMRWRSGTKPVAIGKLKETRTFATVLELNDQRLIVVGGETSKRLESTADQCPDCSDETVSSTAMEPATTTEIFDDAKSQWLVGPKTNFPGGRALKLANGKIFKLSLVGRWSAEDGYRAEMSDALFTAWKPLPPFPLKPFNIRHMVVAGDRVLLFSEKATAPTVVWDDARQKWTTWSQWFKTEPLSVIPIDTTRAIIRSHLSYEVASFPN